MNMKIEFELSEIVEKYPTIDFNGLRMIKEGLGCKMYGRKGKLILEQIKGVRNGIN